MASRYDNVKNMLLNPHTVGLIKNSIDNDDFLSRFAIYRRNGSVEFSKVVKVGKKEHRINNEADLYSHKTELSIRDIYKNGYEIILRLAPFYINYVTSYLKKNKLPNIINEDDLLVFGEWRMNELDESSVKIIKSELFSGGNVFDPLILLSIMTYGDYIMLNELKGLHPNTIFIRGQSTRKNGNEVHLELLEQLIGKMDLHELAFHSMINEYGDWEQGMQKLVEKTKLIYRKESGLLDLERKMILLGSDLPI